MRRLGASVAASLLFAACGTTIQPGQRGVKYIALNDQALEEEVRPEGFYWQWPWNKIVAYDVTWQSSLGTIQVSKGTPDAKGQKTTKRSVSAMTRRPASSSAATRSQ